MKAINLWMVCGLIIVLSACKKTEEENSIIITPKEVFTGFVNHVGKPNYDDFEMHVFALKNAINALNENPSDENLANAQVSWYAVRAEWEQAEAWLWGPIADDEIDPQIDSWPTNTTDLNALIESNNSLSLENVQKFDNFLKGFHPLEYLLFGVNKSKKASQLTTREKLYLASLAQHLTDLVTSVKINYANYATAEMLNINPNNKDFTSDYQGLYTISNGLVGIVDEVANGKIQVPIDEYVNNHHDPANFEESQYALNTLTDFYNNIVGVQNVYLCQYGSSKGTGLTHLVASYNQDLDNRIKNQIERTKTAIKAIHNQSLGEAIKENLAQVKNAQKELLVLKTILETELIGLIELKFKK